MEMRRGATTEKKIKNHDVSSSRDEERELDVQETTKGKNGYDAIVKKNKGQPRKEKREWATCVRRVRDVCSRFVAARVCWSIVAIRENRKKRNTACFSGQF